MNVREAAEYLFVSSAHVRRLVDQGDLVARPSDASNELDIDIESLTAYRAKVDQAAERYQRGNREE